MNDTIFIPQRINVGFQERDDTYTGKLAYIIYYDNKNKLRKEGSWNSWRDHKIPNEEFDNVPMEGFVLNKKVGDYSSHWNHRSAKIRVYDPRNFEFEITVENLLFILENCSAIKGKGLEGQFVHAWDGKENFLLPASCPEYNELERLNKLRFQNKKFKGKDLILGATYLTKDNKELIYMGRYNYHGSKSHKKAYFFYNRNGWSYDNIYWENSKRIIDKYGVFEDYASIGTVLIDCISEECVEDYADIFDDMEYYETYNPYDSTKDEYFEHTVKSFTNYIMNQYNDSHEYYSKEYHIKHDRSKSICYYLDYRPKESNTENNETYFRTSLHHSRYYSSYYSTDFYVKDNMFKWTIETKVKNDEIKYSWRNNYKTVEEYYKCTIEEFVNKYKPMWKKEYLADGKLRKVVYYDNK